MNKPIENLEPAGFESMSKRDRKEAAIDLKREAFRGAIWALMHDLSRDEIIELFESEIKL